MYIGVHRIQDGKYKESLHHLEACEKLVGRDYFFDGIEKNLTNLGNQLYGSWDFQPYYRPTDFTQAREFVRTCDDIPEGNKEHFIELLDILERDAELYFDYS